MKILTLLAFLTLSSLRLSAFTRSGSTYKTDGSQADVQAALNAAANGSTITLPAGTFSWSKTAAKNSIGVTIQGAGLNSTILINTTHGARAPWVIDLTGSSTPTTITGISFKGNKSLQVGALLCGAGTAPFRIYKCSFDSGTEQAVLLQVFGNVPGLIDHCTFSGGDASEMVHNDGCGADSRAGWLDNVYPGSASAVYVEDCTFSKNPLQDAYFRGTSGLQAFYGSRTVVRHCTFNACQVDQHGTKGAIGARWFEIYNNIFYTPPGMYQSNYFDLRGGSGVVFNNVNTGQNATVGGGIIDVRDENAGTSPLYFGRGIDQKYSPVYIWNNGPVMPVVSRSSNVIAGRDYFVSTSQPSSMLKWQLSTDTAQTTYNYSPYVYPHPLDNKPTRVFGPVPDPTPTPEPFKRSHGQAKRAMTHQSTE